MRSRMRSLYRVTTAVVVSTAVVLGLGACSSGQGATGATSVAIWALGQPHVLGAYARASGFAGVGLDLVVDVEESATDDDLRALVPVVAHHVEDAGWHGNAAGIEFHLGDLGEFSTAGGASTLEMFLRMRAEPRVSGAFARSGGFGSDAFEVILEDAEPAELLEAVKTLRTLAAGINSAGAGGDPIAVDDGLAAADTDLKNVARGTFGAPLDDAVAPLG